MQNYWLSDVNYQKSLVKNINEAKNERTPGTVAPAEREFADFLLAIVKNTASFQITTVTEFGLGTFLKQKMRITRLGYVAKIVFSMNQHLFVKLLNKESNLEGTAD
jgi:hypothetical protein